VIRNARFTDIPSILLLMHEGHARSHHAGDARVGIDETHAKKLLMTGIQRHGGHNGGSTWVQVSERAGVVEGFMIGVLDRAYVIGNMLMATDLLFYCSPRAEPMDAMKLARGFLEWARSCPDLIEVKVATTALVGDPAAAGRIWERLGLSRYGEIWRMGL
jgi:hypothetical protein